MENSVKAQSQPFILQYTVIRMILFWCALIVVSSVYVTTPLLSILADTFQVTQARASWTSSAFSLFYAVGFLFFGPISDRFGRKQVILFGLGALSVVTAITGYTDTFILLVICRGMQGFFAATFAPTALAYVFDVFPKEKIATTIGFISFGFVLSGIVGQVVADIIILSFNWQVVFYVFASLYFVSLIIVSICLPGTERKVSKINIDDYVQQARVVLMRRNILLCYVITFLLLLTFIGMYTALGDYISSPLFKPTNIESSTVRGLGIIGMILSPFAGFFVKKFGVLHLLRGSLAIAVTGLLLIGVGSSLVFVIGMSILFVAGFSLIFPAIMMLIGELGGKNRAVAASLYAFILFIGATIGPIISLALMQLGNFLITFGILAMILAVGLVVSFFIKLK